MMVRISSSHRMEVKVMKRISTCLVALFESHVAGWRRVGTPTPSCQVFWRAMVVMKYLQAVSAHCVGLYWFIYSQAYFYLLCLAAIANDATYALFDRRYFLACVANA